MQTGGGGGGLKITVMCLCRFPYFLNWCRLLFASLLELVSVKCNNNEKW